MEGSLTQIYDKVNTTLTGSSFSSPFVILLLRYYFNTKIFKANAVMNARSCMVRIKLIFRSKLTPLYRNVFEWRMCPSRPDSADIPAEGIDKKLSMHIARPSFAQIAANKIPVQIFQKIYRHRHISTTVGYQLHFTTQHTDDALDQVIGDD